MKTRESGMPPEATWQAFFDPAAALTRLGLSRDCGCAVDFGCGYGTFAVPCAEMIRGRVLALDIDPEMVARTRARSGRLSNIEVVLRDFVQAGSGLPDRSADFVMLFNILHAEEAPALLAEARRILKVGAALAVMHWNYDPTTPRGPSMAIRLQPAQCADVVRQAGFEVGELLDLPPYHYGFRATATP